VPVKLPFQIIAPDGSKATIAMFQRHTSSADSVLANSILVGTLGDTTRLSVPPDVWVPGDVLYVVETALRDSVIVGSGGTRTTIVKDTTINGQPVKAPIQVQGRRLAFSPLVLGCAFTNSIPNRFSCNPIALGTPSSTGYLPYATGYKNVVDFARPFDLFSELRLTASAPVASGQQLRSGELARVRVVPNPYIVQSEFDRIDPARQGQPRILFTNVPEQGVLRIYSMSGQLVQQLTWTLADLVNRGTEGSEMSGPGATVNGDLPYNLLTREGLELGTGLYMYVLTAKGPTGNGRVARGKFVIIR
jgi:hypothetical protein